MNTLYLFPRGGIRRYLRLAIISKTITKLDAIIGWGRKQFRNKTVFRNTGGLSETKGTKGTEN